MVDSAWITLRLALVDGYDELSRKLARALGSRDRAENALHDTWLRLSRETASAPGEIRNPRGYLLKMALNVAASSRRSEPRWLTYEEREAFLAALDDQPSPEAAALVRSQLTLVAQAMAQMPARRRAIFEAAWFDQRQQKDIAAEHGLSVRMVQIELNHAMAHLQQRVARSVVVDFASSVSSASFTHKERT